MTQTLNLAFSFRLFVLEKTFSVRLFQLRPGQVFERLESQVGVESGSLDHHGFVEVEPGVVEPEAGVFVAVDVVERNGRVVEMEVFLPRTLSEEEEEGRHVVAEEGEVFSSHQRVNLKQGAVGGSLALRKEVRTVQNEKEGRRNLRSFERIATDQGGSLMKKKGG